MHFLIYNTSYNEHTTSDFSLFGCPVHKIYSAYLYILRTFPSRRSHCPQPKKVGSRRSFVTPARLRVHVGVIWHHRLGQVYTYPFRFRRADIPWMYQSEVPDNQILCSLLRQCVRTREGPKSNLEGSKVHHHHIVRRSCRVFCLNNPCAHRGISPMSTVVQWDLRWMWV